MPAIHRILTTTALCLAAMGVSFMSSCSEEQDVRLNQLEEKFSIQLQLINIEYARHHLDYGVVYIKLHNSPGNEFWSSLESHGWEKDADSSTISYSREGYRLEYINAEQLIVIEPPLKVTP